MDIVALDGIDGGWLLRGPSRWIDACGIWRAIEQALRPDPAAACISCDGLTLSRAEVLAATASLATPQLCGRVGVHMARSTMSVLTTLAVWRAGGVYVPLPTEHPPVKIAAMIRGCTLDLVISDRKLDMPELVLLWDVEVGVAGVPGRLYLHRRSSQELAQHPAGPALARACYIAHTSGSTGDPKGVVVSHDALLNRIACMHDLLDVTAADRFLYKSSSVFDVHVWEFVLPLTSGCHLSIYPQSGSLDLHAVADIMREDGVTIVGFVPSLLRLLLQMDRFTADNSLRAVLCGGEAWHPPLARAFHQALPGRALFNSYGPTETTVAVANWRVPDAEPSQILLGPPLDNVLFFIEEHARSMTADGMEVIGPLHVGGVQVALGYVDARGGGRFQNREIDGRPVRFYATGDIVRLALPRGELAFQGRADNQIKINGVRIELEEVEEAVCSADGVADCVAFLRDAGPPQLWVALLAAPGRRVDAGSIRAACAQRLSRVIPLAGLRQLPAFPYLANGKVDRRAVIRATFQEGTELGLHDVSPVRAVA